MSSNDETERGFLKKYLYTFVSVVASGVCILLGKPLTSATVLSALAPFRSLQEPIYNLPELISMVVIHAAEFAWQERPTIQITEELSILKGSKVVISGKTSFLCSILGEIPRLSGLSIETYGSKALVLQSAWIQTGTVRDNVLFGNEMNKHLYENVVEACALNHDIEMWADGDLYVVGERGLNLSGGQKQRVQRASAVDAHTGAHMFEKCDKTVIYVTHQLEFLDSSDLVLVMKDGRIVESGTHSDLISNSDGELMKQMMAHRKSLDQLSLPKLKHGEEIETEACQEKSLDLSKSDRVLFLFLIVLAISIWYQAYYISTARELARMVPTQQAPILHHFSESIAGASVIRCFNQEQRFWKSNADLIDNYSSVAFYNFATMEWLCVRINFLFNLVFFVLLLVLVSLPRTAIDPSLAGLAATYGLNLNVIQAWVIWNLCNVENKMITVERILEFCGIKSEAPLIIEDHRPQTDWPCNGEINVENLHVQYNPTLPRVLKGISCTFPGKKKIGIVGRTGSGKSTLIQALFRVVEPSQGSILIDGVDIAKLGLQNLRSRLSIIPQDPTLFQGTLRMNLDPLEEHSDHEIWEVIDKCHLSVNVNKDNRLLEAPVSEDGENWSVGQRKLLCLARALLQRRRILVLDEATASVDSATDNLMQKTIRAETNGCTVITVAHRIPTVVDNDLILVLGEGKVVECDSPSKLLCDGNSAFSGLVKEYLR